MQLSTPVVPRLHKLELIAGGLFNDVAYLTQRKPLGRADEDRRSSQQMSTLKSPGNIFRKAAAREMVERFRRCGCARPESIRCERSIEL